MQQIKLIMKHSRIVLLSFTESSKKRNETENSEASVFAVSLIIDSMKTETAPGAGAFSL